MHPAEDIRLSQKDWDAPTTLTFRCGTTPIMFRTYQQAMWLFRHWWDEQIAGRDAFGPHGYFWTPILPTYPDPACYVQDLTCSCRS